MDKTYNKMKISFSALPENESFIRSTVAAFCLPLNPTLEEISDVKTAVSEAVTNCIVHAYKQKDGEVTVDVIISDCAIHITVSDNGVGIDDVTEALKPFYTTDAENERSGMGFTVMQTFMDTLEVKSEKGVGTKVVMTKKIGGVK